ncbi:E3 ubiquitin-protein ligase makorin, partial [Phtheirospermum japonicum]
KPSHSQSSPDDVSCPLEANSEHSSSIGPFYPPTTPAWTGNPDHHDVLDKYHDLGPVTTAEPSDHQPMCSFATVGHCPRGEKCPHVHGDKCPICKKQCLHPFRPRERDEHLRNCEKRQKHLEALTRSQGIECSVCLELVLSKSTPSERKFGILSECDHAFCVSCIRSWRGNLPSSGLDVNSAVRACPICRKLSYFVVPSVIWYFSEEEKREIVESYKAKLKSIDCKHFDFGNGSCPFGTSCFYKHAYRDGSLEEVVLRHLGAEDGNTVIAKDIRLSDFLSNLQIR